MKVARKTLVNYNISASCWFATNSDRDLYFINNPNDLIPGIYCAVGGDPLSEDYDTPVWQLQFYNGNSWILTAINENFALAITNAGLQAVVNASTGQIKIKISRIKMIAESLANSTLPLIYYTDADFVGENKAVPNTVVIDWNEVGGETSELATHLTYRPNLSNSGLQYVIDLKPGDISVSGLSSFYVGAIGLYIQDQASNSNNDILFGIATVANPILKVGTNAEGLGSSLKFYLNAVLDNLGYISDVTILDSEVNSVPEVDTEASLTGFGGLQDPYNLYVVNDLYNTGIPAIAIRQGLPSNLSWVYCTPSNNMLSLTADDFASDVKNYMAVAYDSTRGKYVKADGESDYTSTQALAIRVNNNIIFAGNIRNLTNISTIYNYNFSIENGGAHYNVGDIVYFVYNIPGSSSRKTLKLKVTEITAEGAISNFEPEITTGSILLNNTYDLIYYSGSGTIPGSGATINVTSLAQDSYPWNFPASDINKPVYADTGANAGMLTTTKTKTFVGWIMGPNVLQLGLDLDASASYTIQGVTRYATDSEVGDIANNTSAKSTTAVTPEWLNKHYLQKTLINAASEGGTANNPQIIDTHTRFTKTIQSTVDGVAFQGTSYRALWADLAEYYRSDKVYDAGTLITIGAGNAEITEARVGTECNGIISEKPGYQLGNKESDKDLPVALVGRIKVLFDGDCSIHFGDRVYLSQTKPGRASTIPYGNCLGKVIEQDPNGKAKVLCSIRINF